MAAMLLLSVTLSGLLYGPSAVPAPPLAEMNRAFLAQLPADDPSQALAVASIREALSSEYRDRPQSFIPEALALLDPVYDEALRVLDGGEPEVAIDLLAQIADAENPYLRANAGYWRVRLLAELGRYEEVVALTEEERYARSEIVAYTPYVEQFELLRATALARVLDFEQAEEALAEQMLRAAPELVRNAGRQLQLELDRRNPKSLGEVALYMDYVRERLSVPDTGDKVRERQDEILAMLDELIEQAEQQEKSGGGGGGGKRAGAPQPGGPQGQGQSGGSPAEESDERDGPGRIGDLHSAPRIEPGEMWGKLPPDERDRILQSIRERFPSRYRQLVEQYYRALAEQP